MYTFNFPSGIVWLIVSAAFFLVPCSHGGHSLPYVLHFHLSVLRWRKYPQNVARDNVIETRRQNSGRDSCSHPEHLSSLLRHPFSTFPGGCGGTGALLSVIRLLFLIWNPCDDSQNNPWASSPASQPTVLSLLQYSSTERLCLSPPHPSASVALDSTTLCAVHEFLSIHGMGFWNLLNMSSYLCTSFWQDVSSNHCISQTNPISVLAAASPFKPHGRLIFPQRPSLPVSNSSFSFCTVVSCDSLVKWYLLRFLMIFLKGISFQVASCHLNLIYYASLPLA